MMEYKLVALWAYVGLLLTKIARPTNPNVSEYHLCCFTFVLGMVFMYGWERAFKNKKEPKPCQT